MAALPPFTDDGYLPERFNLAQHVLGRAEALQDKIALQIVGPTGAERWSYGRLLTAVLGIAAGLRARGLSPGDRILLRLGNGVDFPLAFLGAIAADLVPVAAPSGLTVPEVSSLAAALAPALVIASPGLSRPEAAFPTLAAADLRAMADGPAGPFATGPAGRPGYIVYTSGTSGSPRAVLHAHRAILARRMMWDGWYGLGEGNRMLHAGALNWTFTLGTGLLDPWTIGATALVPAEGTAPEKLPLLLRRYDATLFAAAPGIFRKILSAAPDRLPLPRLRHALSAGERLPDQIRAGWQAATDTPIFEAYGLSECSTFISGSPARPAPLGATGYPQPGRRMALIGADGTEVPAGAPGTIAIHRTDPGLFLAYVGHEDEARARFSGDWFLTGDMASADPDGAIRYLGRDDDMLNAGGFRVSPVEIESAFACLAGAGEVAAVELRPDPTRSFIALVLTGDIDDDRLVAHAAAELAPYKRPRLYLRRPALPHTANGKVNRRILREETRLDD